MALDATLGGENSNSYVTVQEADDYFDNRLHSDLWIDDVAIKEKALITATRMLERYVDWLVLPFSDDQALTWPDSITEEIIDEVKEATFELAYNIIPEDRTAESDLKGFKSLKVGSLSIAPDKEDRKGQSLIPDYIFQIVKNYGTLVGASAFVELQRG